MTLKILFVSVRSSDSMGLSNIQGRSRKNLEIKICESLLVYPPNTYIKLIYPPNTYIELVYPLNTGRSLERLQIVPLLVSLAIPFVKYWILAVDNHHHRIIFVWKCWTGQLVVQPFLQESNPAIANPIKGSLFTDSEIFVQELKEIFVQMPQQNFVQRFKDISYFQRSKKSFYTVLKKSLFRDPEKNWL